jgi:hypothetical protein
MADATTPITTSGTAPHPIVGPIFSLEFHR